MMMMIMRKGPWTEEEDIQLVLYVNLYGDRRWDFIAKVSGLRRTGKSCRLRWVNYLHPGLKRGKMTPQEERLVLELHSKWGNRWSRIARKLPGRTDNEIKNYWRTLMRKTAQAQEKKSHSIISLSSPMISNCSSSSGSNPVSSMPVGEGDERSFYDTGGLKHVNSVPISTKEEEEEEEEEEDETNSDNIWKDITMNETNMFCDGNLSYQTIPSPIWDKYSPGSLWNILDTEPISLCNEDSQYQNFAEYEVNQLAASGEHVSDRLG